MVMISWNQIKSTTDILPHYQHTTHLGKDAVAADDGDGNDDEDEEQYEEQKKKKDDNDDDNNTWWHHQMETFFALLAICAGNSPVTGDAELWWFLWSAPE